MKIISFPLYPLLRLWLNGHKYDYLINICLTCTTTPVRAEVTVSLVPGRDPGIYSKCSINKSNWR